MLRAATASLRRPLLLLLVRSTTNGSIHFPSTTTVGVPAAASFSSRTPRQQQKRRGSQQQQRQRQQAQQAAAQQQQRPKPQEPGKVVEEEEEVTPLPGKQPTLQPPPLPLNGGIPPPRGIMPATLVPLDLCTYHTLLSKTHSPKEALVLLEEMDELGLSLTSHAYVSALRVCASHPEYVDQSLGLLQRLQASLVVGEEEGRVNELVEGYSLALAACVRAGGLTAYKSAYALLDTMKAKGIGPGVCTYKELARACLEPKTAGEKEEARALEFFREVLSLPPGGEGGVVGGGEEKKVSASSTTAAASAAKKMTIKCRNEGEARWVQSLLKAKATGNVETGLALLAQGLTVFVVGKEGGGAAGGSMMLGEDESAAFACNLVLSTCIKAGAWKEAGQVKELMQNLQVAPDAFSLNSLLAQSLAQLRQPTTKPFSSSSPYPSKEAAQQAAVETIKELMTTYHSLSPNVNTFRAVLNACGVERLFELCVFVQEKRGGEAVPAPTYKLLLETLDMQEGGEGLKKQGLPFVARA